MLRCRHDSPVHIIYSVCILLYDISDLLIYSLVLKQQKKPLLHSVQCCSCSNCLRSCLVKTSRATVCGIFLVFGVNSSICTDLKYTDWYELHYLEEMLQRRWRRSILRVVIPNRRDFRRSQVANGFSGQVLKSSIWRRHNPSGKSIPLLDCPHSVRFFCLLSSQNLPY